MLLIGGLRTPGSPPDPPSENEHFELAESAVTLFEGGSLRVHFSTWISHFLGSCFNECIWEGR